MNRLSVTISCINAQSRLKHLLIFHTRNTQNLMNDVFDEVWRRISLYILMVLNYNWTRIFLRSSFAKSLQSLSGITSHNWWQFTQVHKSELEMQWIAQDYWRYTVTTHSRSALPLVCIVEVRRFRTRYDFHKHIQNWSLENREEVGRGSKHHSECADSAWQKLSCAGTL